VRHAYTSIFRETRINSLSGKLKYTAHEIRHNDLDQSLLVYNQREVTFFIKLNKKIQCTRKHWFIDYMRRTKATMKLYNITITLWNWYQQTGNSETQPISNSNSQYERFWERKTTYSTITYVHHITFHVHKSPTCIITYFPWLLNLLSTFMVRTMLELEKCMQHKKRIIFSYPKCKTKEVI